MKDPLLAYRAFVAVARSGSFTAAADRLGTSRALVSKHVAQLEDHLGARLLNRTTRSVDIAPAGRACLDRAARLIDDHDALEADMRGRGGEPTGTIRIAAPANFADIVLPDLLPAFAARYPGIEVSIALGDRYVNLVAEGFDMAIRIGALDDSSLIARRLCMTSLTCCAAPAYLASAGTPDDPANLADHRCLLDDNMRETTLWPFDPPVRVRGPITVNSAGLIRTLVLGGEGVALVPSFLVTADIASGRLVRLLSDHPLPAFGIHAVYPPGRHLSPGIRAFIDMLAARFRDSA